MTETPRVICDSGIEGWQCRLRENYTSYTDFVVYSETYGLHARLGFDCPEDAWRENPLVQGSSCPDDFRRVYGQPNEP